jgi:hypothetical protein
VNPISGTRMSESVELPTKFIVHFNGFIRGGCLPYSCASQSTSARPRVEHFKIIQKCMKVVMKTRFLVPSGPHKRTYSLCNS